MPTAPDTQHLLHPNDTLVDHLREGKGRYGHHAMTEGILIRNHYKSPWFGIVEVMGFSGDSPFAIVRRVCTADGRRFRKTSVCRRHPYWFTPVTTIPIREDAEVA